MDGLPSFFMLIGNIGGGEADGWPNFRQQDGPLPHIGTNDMQREGGIPIYVMNKISKIIRAKLATYVEERESERRKWYR